MDEVLLQLLNRLINLLSEFRIVHHLADARAYVDENHDDAVTLQLHVSLELSWQEARCSEEALCVFKHLDGALCPVLVACSESILRHRDCGEGLREHVATLAQWLALSRHREVHVSLLVEAVLLDKLECRLGSVEPLLILLYIVISE